MSSCDSPGGPGIPAGSGHCKNDTRDVCDGEWYTGDAQHFPCRGGDEIRCCVHWSSMDNGTTSTTTTTTTTTGGLTGPQIGGTVGGVVGFVVLAVAGLLLWYFLYWKKKKQHQQHQQHQQLTDRDSREAMFPGGAGPGHGYGYVPVSELHGQGTAVVMHQIDGKERMELDGHGQAILEMDANSGPVELDASESGTVRDR